MQRNLPPSPHLFSSRRWKGLKVGLLGGSFNPPHAGHMHIALSAMRYHKLHAVWWMVSPQNPLKRKSNNFEKRLQMTRNFICHQPKMLATNIETQVGSRYSLQTVRALKARFPQTRFIWIAGMDNATLFHRWDGWRNLLRIIPFAFFNRPPLMMAVNTNAIRMYRGKKDVQWHLKGKTRNISSTALRHKKIARFF